MFSTILNKIEDYLKDVGLFQEIWTYEVEEFKGDPAVVIVPSSNESEYDTTQENMRIYAFTIRIFANRTTRTEPKKTADRILRDLVDATIDKFDKYYSMRTVGTPGGTIVEPPGYTFINVFATPSAWGYSGREDEYRVAEINLRCRVSVDLYNI